MMKRLSCALAASVVLQSAPVSAQTLDEALRVAVAGNPAIAAERARLKAAEEAVPQARSGALPSISAAASATSSRNRLEDGAGGPTVRSSSDAWTSGVSASQTLFASGGVFADIRRAKADVEAARANYRATEQSFLLAVVDAYTGFREAQQVAAARTRTVENLEVQRKYADAQFRAGLATRTNVAQAQARLAAARTQLIQAQGNLAAANETYRRLVGHPPEGLSPAPAAANLPADLPTALNDAVSNSPILIAARASEDSARERLNVARSEFGPTVSLEAGANLSSSFDDFADRSNGASVGVRFSIPLFSGGLNASRARAASSSLLAAGLDRNDAENQLRQDVTTAWTNLIAARAAYDSSQRNVEAAELAYKGVILEQEVGLRALVDVFDTEDQLLSARLALASAERQLAVAERALLAATGQLTTPAEAVVPKKPKLRPRDAARAAVSGE
jgi:outer membrane protein